MSKRQFDGYVKAWRRALHRWDAPDAGEAAATFALGRQAEPQAQAETAPKLQSHVKAG